MILFTLILGALSLVVILYAVPKFFLTLHHHYVIRKAALRFHCMPRWWFWGNLHQVCKAGDLLTLTDTMLANKIQAYVLWFGCINPVLFLVSPGSAKVILKTSEPKSPCGFGYKFLLPWLGDGLVISSGKKWERNRSLLTPAFHLNILQSYMGIYNNVADMLIMKLAKMSTEGNSLEICEPLSLATLDVLLRCIFSFKGIGQKDGSEHPYVHAINRVSHLIVKRMITLPSHAEFIYRLTSSGKEFFNLCDCIHKFDDEIISARKQMMKDNAGGMKKRGRIDLLDILLSARDDEGNGLTDLEIKNEVDTFMFAGYDTTAITTSWAIHSLGKYPEEQEKVWNEIQSVLQGRHEVTWEDLNKLKYLTAFIKESMRINTTVPFILRQLTQPYMIEGINVPAGMIIAINLYGIHHNEKVWPQPELFRPERFLSDEYSDKDPFIFVPFSAGPRNCIGQNFAMNELKVILSKTLQSFRIIDDPNHSVRCIPDLVMRSETGIKVCLQPR